MFLNPLKCLVCVLSGFCSVCVLCAFYSVIIHSMFVFLNGLCVCSHLLVCGVTCLQCLSKVLLFLAVFLGLCCAVWLCVVSYLQCVWCHKKLQCVCVVWCELSEVCGLQRACVSSVCSELVVWCELSAAHIAHKSSSNQDINGNLKVL